MKWEDTEASRCRYGDIAGSVWGDYDIIWEKSEVSWQGDASFLGYHHGVGYVYYAWSYGSCSGCDDWESRWLSDKEIAKEMVRDSVSFDDIDHVYKYFRNFQDSKDILTALDKYIWNIEELD